MASKARPAALLALLLTFGLIAPQPAAVAESGTATGPLIENPVGASFADTFADPSVIEGKDGWWYAYATSDPLRAGDEPGLMHIARTRDFTQWEYRGTVFSSSNRPSWATQTSGLWAPDVRYVDGRYLMYYTVTDTTLHPGDADSAIGAAEAPTPEGPWTPTDKPVVAPREGNGGFLWTFDPSGFTDVHGNRYLYFGSYNGGVWVTRVSDDGLAATGSARMVAIDNKFEGAYVIRHGRWYYLLSSSANCCAGPATGYSVFAGRSRSPLGPFKDADGIPLVASRAGGTLVVTQNGNRWIGAGHNAVLTDHAGRDFLVYHAIDRNNPWLAEPFGINRRPMLIDRVDWVRGWPRVRAGAGPSDGPHPGPLTGSDLGIDPANPVPAFSGLAAGPEDPQAGATGRVTGTARSTATLDERRFRLRLDLRTDRRLTVVIGKGSAKLTVTVNSGTDALVVRGRFGARSWTDRAPIRLESSGWRTLVIEVTPTQVLAQLGEDDPQAEVRHALRRPLAADAPLRLRSTDALVDNVSVRRLAREAARLVPQPTTGRLLDGDEFTGSLEPEWSWVRKNPDADVTGGRLNWPLEAADLTGTSNNAGVLLRQPPSGNYIAETKLTLDLGTDVVRNFQQAGIIAYRSDDDFARLSSVAIWNTRQTEFGRELVATSGGQTIYGGAIIGTPAPTMWLRLAHTVSASGEHRYRAGTSRDRRHWTWGAVWTFPAGAQPRIGLVAHGGSEPATVASFDYLRFYAYRTR